MAVLSLTRLSLPAISLRPLAILVAVSLFTPAPTIAAKQSATGTKTDTPGVTGNSRGASNTYDVAIVRGFASRGLNQNNYLDGQKLQGDFWMLPAASRPVAVSGERVASSSQQPPSVSNLSGYG